MQQDPELLKKLTPDFKIGCQRILLSDDYYPAIQRENVHIITDPIQRIGQRGIVSQNGREFNVEAIIYATGFNVEKYPVQVYGLKGIDLRDEWKRRGGMQAYLGITVPGFPNFFFLLGPNTGLGNNSVVLMIECQTRYAIQCIQYLRKQNGKYLDLHDDAMKKFHEECRASLAKTVWATNCSSWYKNPDGDIPTLWPYSTVAYWRRTRKVNFKDYQLFKT